MVKRHHSLDSVKSIYIPVVYSKDGTPKTTINKCIKEKIFRPKKSDSTQLAQDLLNAFYAKYKGLRLSYEITFNKKGFLSISIDFATSCEEENVPIYLNFDLTTGEPISLRDLLNSKNDSISMRQAILPPITDSIRNFEQTLDKNNPKYSDIIEELNSQLGTFSHFYPFDFIMTDKEIIFYFDCILPSNLMPYHHIYKAHFSYKTLKNVMKKAITTQLQ